MRWASGASTLSSGATGLRTEEGRTLRWRQRRCLHRSALTSSASPPLCSCHRSLHLCSLSILLLSSFTRRCHSRSVQRYLRLSTPPRLPRSPLSPSIAAFLLSLIIVAVAHFTSSAPLLASVRRLHIPSLLLRVSSLLAAASLLVSTAPSLCPRRSTAPLHSTAVVLSHTISLLSLSSSSSSSSLPPPCPFPLLHASRSTFHPRLALTSSSTTAAPTSTCTPSSCITTPGTSARTSTVSSRWCP